MKSFIRVSSGVGLFLVLVVLFSGCFGANDRKKATSPATDTAADYKYGKIEIPGKEGSLCAAPIYIAYEKGFYAEEGFEVNLISANTETRKIGLNNGTIPIVNGDFQFFPSIENEVKVKVVDGLHFGCIKLLVHKAAPIYSAKDLRGKRISVDEIGGTPHQVAAVWLEKNGISAKPEDRQVTFLPFADGNLAVEALNKGEVDVAALWDPFGSVLEKTGNYRVILDIATDEPFADKFCCFLYASEKLIKEEPEKVAALLRAYRKAQDWIAANPEATVDLIIKGKYSQVEDRDLAIELIKSYAYPTTADRSAKPTQVRDNVRYFAEQLYSIGYLTTDPETFTKHAYVEIDINLGK